MNYFVVKQHHVFMISKHRLYTILDVASRCTLVIKFSI